MVLLLKLGFCILTRREKGASHYPKTQPLLLSSSAKSETKLEEGQLVATILSLCVLQDPVLPPTGCPPSHPSDCIFILYGEAKYAQPIFWTFTK